MHRVPNGLASLPRKTANLFSIMAEAVGAGAAFKDEGNVLFKVSQHHGVDCDRQTWQREAQRGAVP